MSASGPPIRISIEYTVDQAAASRVIDTSVQQLGARVTTQINTGLNQTATILTKINQIGGQGVPVLTQYRNLMTSISTTFYSLEKIGGLAKNWLVDPFVNASKAIVDATENSRQWEIAVSGVVGSMARARELRLSLVGASQFSPQSIEQLQTAGKVLASNPSTAYELSLGTTQSSTKLITQYAELAGRFQQVAPDGADAGEALRSALGNNYRRLSQFGLSQETLASLADSSVAQLRTDPSLVLKGAQRFADIFFPEASYQATSGLISVRIQKLKDAVEAAEAKIGNSGVFDSLSKRLQGISGQLFTYFDSPQFTQQAGRISNSLDQVIGNVARSGEHLLDAITGKPSDISTVAGATNTVANLLERIAKLSDTLPATIDKAGPAITAMANKLGAFQDAVVKLAEIAADPDGYYAKQHPKIAGVASFTGGGIDAASAGVAGGIDRIGQGPGPVAAGFLTGALRSTIDYGLRTNGYPSLNELEHMRAGMLGSISGPTSRPTTGPSSQPSSLGDLAGHSEIADLIEKLTGEPYYAPNYGTLLLKSNASVAALREAAQHQETPIERYGQISDIFGNLTENNEPIEFKAYLDRADQRYQEALGQANKALGATHDPDEINRLNAFKTNLGGDYQDAISTIQTDKTKDVQLLSEQLWSAISDLPPTARVEIQSAILGGSTDAARQFKQVFDGAEPPAGFGIASFPLDTQRHYINQNIAANLEALKAAGVNQNPQQSQSALLNYYQTQALPEQQDLLSRATANYGANPTQLNKAEVDAAQASVVDLTAKIRDLRFETNDAAKTFAQFGASARQSLEGGLGDALFNLQTGMGSLSDVAKQTFQSILHEADQAASHLLFQGLFGNLGQANQGTNGVGPGQGGGLFGGLIGSIVGAFAGPLWGGAAANLISGQPINSLGGVGSVPYGPSITGFASGGVVSSPTLAMIGEGRFSEAVVPLPNGSHIPVEMRGGGGKTINITQHFTTPSPEAFRKSAAQIKRQTRDAIGVE